ncbi:MAG: hypothetical protein V1798_02400 [Pseudomonadota bacterium]
MTRPMRVENRLLKACLVLLFLEFLSAPAAAKVPGEYPDEGDNAAYRIDVGEFRESLPPQDREYWRQKLAGRIDELLAHSSSCTPAVRSGGGAEVGVGTVFLAAGFYPPFLIAAVPSLFCWGVGVYLVADGAGKLIDGPPVVFFVPSGKNLKPLVYVDGIKKPDELVTAVVDLRIQRGLESITAGFESGQRERRLRAFDQILHRALPAYALKGPSHRRLDAKLAPGN